MESASAQFRLIVEGRKEGKGKELYYLLILHIRTSVCHEESGAKNREVEVIREKM